MALEVTGRNLIGDALHVRAVKPRGATTRDAAIAISERRGLSSWLDPEFQNDIAARIARVCMNAGREFGTGPEGFRWLTQ